VGPEVLPSKGSSGSIIRNPGREGGSGPVSGREADAGTGFRLCTPLGHLLVDPTGEAWQGLDGSRLVPGWRRLWRVGAIA
jgi:hypothetical protein